MGSGDQSLKQQRAVLMILVATCERALEAFQAAENLEDEAFIQDLERIITRSRSELEALVEKINAA